MNATATISNNVAKLSGTLDHASVAHLLDELIDGEEYSAVCLQGVEHSNSAGVALLLELIEAHDGELKITDIPPQMQRVAELSGVAELLNC